MRILITGSSGFLGGSCGRFAARCGHEIAGVGRSPAAGSDWPGAYASVNGELQGISEILDRFSPDVIFHAAGTASVGASFDDPFADFQGSVVACENLLDGVRRSTSRPLIFIPSSAAVYGDAHSLPISESAHIKPISPYGVHKAVCETLARGWAESFGLRIVVSRLFSVFGPSQKRLLVWELFNQLSGKSGQVTLAGTGTESRDFLYVDDVARALLQLSAALRDVAPGYFQILNVASGKETTVAYLANHLRDMVAPQKEISYQGLVRPGDPSHWRADISKLTALAVDWRPEPLCDALARCISSWREPAVLHHEA